MFFSPTAGESERIASGPVIEWRFTMPAFQWPIVDEDDLVIIKRGKAILLCFFLSDSARNLT